VTTSLTAFLKKKVTDGCITGTQRDAAHARYNDATVKNILPDAKLRAGLVSLIGTVGEPDISAILDGKNVTGKAWTIVGFSSAVSSSSEFAETKTTSTGRLRTLFRLKYQGEPFQALGAKLAHEAMHQDGDDGVKEEEFVNTVETMVYAQQLLVDRTTAQGVVATNSEMTKAMDTKLYAMIESGRALFPRVGTLQGAILNGATTGVFPGSATPSDGMGVFKSFDDYIRRQYLARGFSDISSVGNAAMSSDFKLITGSSPAANTFDTTLISVSDSKQVVITDKGAIELARVLKMTV